MLRKRSWEQILHTLESSFFLHSLLSIRITTSAESNDQRQVSICLIFIYWRFSVQFVTPTSQFTPFESNGLVYKPHPRFLTQNFGKKVRLIHEFLRYLSKCTISIQWTAYPWCQTLYACSFWFRSTLYSNPDAMPRDLSVISLISQTQFQV